MKRSLLSFSMALSTMVLAANTWAEQQLGAQVRSKPAFGYGKLVMNLSLSTEPGIVNGFFMFKYYKSKTEDATYPNGWTEIDYEYVPGNRESNRRTAEGDCGQPNGNCKIGTLGNQSAADYMSVNIIAGPLDGDRAPDSQVFYKLPSGFMGKPNTYIIEYTPDQIKWSAKGVNQDRPFMYQKSGEDNSDIHQSLGMQYLVNRNMHIWFNIYSGLGEGWGGKGTVPRNITQMNVNNVAFYPATSCNNGSCQYSSEPSMSSDFVNGRYTLNGANSSFDAIWLNEDSNDYPVYTRAANATVIPGAGLRMTYRYQP